MIVKILIINKELEQKKKLIKMYQEKYQLIDILQKQINILKKEIKQLKQSNNENDNNIKIIQEEVINKLNRSSKETSYNLSILKQDLIKNMLYNNKKINDKIKSSKQDYNSFNIIINLLMVIMFVCYIYFYFKNNLIKILNFNI